jgi:hypothetical protein
MTRGRTLFLIGGAAALAAAGVVAACGGDDTKSGPGPSADGAVDAPSLAEAPAGDDIGLPPQPVDAGFDAFACPGLVAAPDPAAVSRGLSLVAQLGCANCHQSIPPAAIVLSGRTTSLFPDADIYPSNLTPDPATGLACWTDAQIANALLHGVDNQDASLCVMPLLSARGVDGGAAMDPVVNNVPQTICPVPDVDAGVDAAGDAGVDAGTDAPADASGG